MSNQNRDLVAEVLAGELAEDAPEFREAALADPALQVELDEMRALITMMDAESTTEREARTAPMLELVEPRQTTSPAFGGKLAGLAAAAALILAIFVLPKLLGSEDPLGTGGKTQMLGVGDVEITNVSPMGTDSTFGTFSAVIAIPKNTSIKLRIWEDSETADAPAIPPHIITREELTADGFTWSPSPETVASFPDSIRWEIYLVGMDEKPLPGWPTSVFASR